MKSRLLAIVIAATSLTLVPARAFGGSACTDPSGALVPTQREICATGLYSLPAKPPTHMVVIMHG